MDASKYDRSLALTCSTCGSTDFETTEATTGLATIVCNACGRSFSEEELVRENGEQIDAEVEQVGKEFAADVEKEVSAMLRKAFSGSKHIKIR